MDKAEVLIGGVKSFLLLLLTLSFASCASMFSQIKIPGEVTPWPQETFKEIIVDPREKAEAIQFTLAHLEENNRRYWGFLKDAEKDDYLRLFDTVVAEIENHAVSLIHIEPEWRATEERLRKRLERSISHGEALGAVTRLSYFLKEGHSMIIPERLIMNNNLRVGAPHLMFMNLGVNPLGAWVTPCEGNRLVVGKVIDQHSPYSWNFGDEIVAANGIPWQEWRIPLEESNLPIIGSLGANENARSMNWQKSFMRNFHLFKTMTVQRVESDVREVVDILPTDFNLEENYSEAPFSILYQPENKLEAGYEPVEGGILAGTNIGYIKINYFDQEINDIETWEPRNTRFFKIFSKAIESVLKTDGIILDLRSHKGGMDQVSYGGLALLVKNGKDQQFYDWYEKMGVTEFQRRTQFERPFFAQNPDTYFNKPIIVLTGSECISGGDIFTAILSAYENVLVIGSDQNGSFAGHEKDKVLVEGSLKILLINPQYLLYRHGTGDDDLRRSYLDRTVEYRKADIIENTDTILSYAIEKINRTHESTANQ